MIRTIAAICSSTSSQGPQEGIDHLFLLPERVLGMDGAQLRKDLAALDFKVQLLQSAPSGNVWLCKYTEDWSSIFMNYVVKCWASSWTRAGFYMSPPITRVV